jgi:protein-disulfide isomerase
MHDQLFFHHQWAQTGKDPSRLFQQFAQDARLDLPKYNECMTSGRFASRIEFSNQEGLSLGVGGTPTFFINGRQFTGPRATSDAFKAVADSIIAHSPKAPARRPARE